MYILDHLCLSYIFKFFILFFIFAFLYFFPFYLLVSLMYFPWYLLNLVFLLVLSSFLSFFFPILPFIISLSKALHLSILFIQFFCFLYMLSFISSIIFLISFKIRIEILCYSCHLLYGHIFVMCLHQPLVHYLVLFSHSTFHRLRFHSFLLFMFK